MASRSFFRRRRRPCFALFAGAALASAPQVALATPLVFDGAVPADDLEHFFVPFDVPEGTKEIEIRHTDGSDVNILDWGLNDPDGYRGWGGGNDEPAVVGELAASRSYIPGPIRAGRWSVVVGKAKIVAPPGKYHVEIELRTTPTLPPATDRKPYTPATAREQDLRYYAGDLHVHSRDSGDAEPTIREDVALAKSRGLDFIEISDHNTVSHLPLFADIQAEEPSFLLVPGFEYTTYHGHANAIGATTWVDHKIGQPGVTLNGAVDAVRAQGAVFSINHPLFDLGNLCIGCAWTYDDVDLGKIGGVEVGTVGGTVFSASALQFWDSLLDKGFKIPALGGGDDHRAGHDTGFMAAKIGSPTTLIRARELSVDGLLEGLRKGATTVKFRGPDDPMVELEIANDDGGDSIGFAGDTIGLPRAIVRAKVTGNVGGSVRLVKNGVPMAPSAVTSDPFVFETKVDAPATGEDRYRAEVVLEGVPVTVTSHVWIGRPIATSPSEGGCSVADGSTHGTRTAAFFLGMLGLAGFGYMRRKRHATR